MREDGLSQSEVAELLGRHKSWVCRRLALLEKLAADVRQELEVGLLTPDGGAGDRPVARRQPIGSPRCVTARGAQRRRARRRGPPAPGVGDGRAKAVRADQAAGGVGAGRRGRAQEGWDPRLSTRGNRVSKQLAVLLDRLAWVENFLECRGWTSLVASDRLVLGPVFARLARDAKCVAEGAGDLAVEMRQP